MRKDDLKRYLLYSLGEILLIIFGILIALSVNNWNEARKDRLEEKEILTVLNEEFKGNIADMGHTLEAHKVRMVAAEKMVEIIENKQTVPNDSLLNEYILNAVYGKMYNPKFGILNSLLYSSKLDLIRSPQLKYALARLPGELEEYREEEEFEFKLLSEQFFPMYAQYSKENISESLKSTVFINAMYQRRQSTNAMLIEGKILLKELKRIKEMIGDDSMNNEQ